VFHTPREAVSEIARPDHFAGAILAASDVRERVVANHRAAPHAKLEVSRDVRAPGQLLRKTIV
jgi:hypothetical protein